MTNGTSNPGRRRIILRAGLAAVAAPAAAVGLSAGLSAPAAAQQKLAKNLIQYVDATPNPAQRCDNCTHWQPPNACAIVEGVIAPAGWCAAWAPKG